MENVDGKLHHVYIGATRTAPPAQGNFHRTPRRNRKRKCDEFDECQIRQKIHRDFFFKNKLPTLTTLQTSIQKDPGLPTVSRSTLATILRRIGFMYKFRKRNSFLCERLEIQMWRHQYLREIRKHRKDNRTMVYTDETWVNAGHTRSIAWQDTRVLSSHQAFLDGLSTEVLGSCLIIVDAGTKDGFIPGASLVFQAKKMTGIITERRTLRRTKSGSGNNYYFLIFLPTAWLCWITPRTIVHRLNCYHVNTGERTWSESGLHLKTFNGIQTWSKTNY